MIFECPECKEKTYMNDPRPNAKPFNVKFCPNCGEKIISRPKINISFEMESLIDICEEYIHRIEHGYTEESNLQHLIFETAMETVYGKDIWDYINENIKRL